MKTTGIILTSIAYTAIFITSALIVVDIVLMLNSVRYFDMWCLWLLIGSIAIRLVAYVISAFGSHYENKAFLKKLAENCDNKTTAMPRTSSFEKRVEEMRQRHKKNKQQ
jgi:hypothetical protein